MNTLSIYTIRSFICCLVGLLLYVYTQGWLLMYLPSQRTVVSSADRHVTKKKVTLFFWYENQWHSEQSYILWHEDDPAQTLVHLVTCWLNAAPYQQTTAGFVHLQTVVTAPQTATAYLSFDASLFAPAQTLREKAFLIEGLLTTIKKNNLPYQHLQFLMHHKPLEDMHLDFSNPWPMNGFLPRPH